METHQFNLEANDNDTETSLLNQPSHSQTISESLLPEETTVSSYVTEDMQNQPSYEQPNLYNTQEITSYIANGFSQLVSSTADAISNLAETYAGNTDIKTIANTTNTSLEVILPETATDSSRNSNTLQILPKLGPYLNYYISNDTTTNTEESTTWNDATTLSTTSASLSNNTTESASLFHQISDKIQEAGTFFMNKTESLFNCSTMPCYETELTTSASSNRTLSKQEQDEKSNQFLYVIITLSILVVIGILSGAFLIRKIRNKRKSFEFMWNIFLGNDFDLYFQITLIADHEKISSYIINGIFSTRGDISNLTGMYAENTDSEIISHTTPTKVKVLLPETAFLCSTHNLKTHDTIQVQSLSNNITESAKRLELSSSIKQSLFKCQTIPFNETESSTSVFNNKISFKQEQDEKSNLFLDIIITVYCCISLSLIISF
nr:unnamed protein product [Callosobruchus analis]